MQDPPADYRLEIGYLADDGFFYCLARSNEVSTPPAGTSDAVDENWTAVAENADRIFAMSGGYSPQGASRELQELLEERLRRPLGSPMKTRFGSGAARPAKASRFEFAVDAEIIVYGAANRDAHVTLQGEPVQLRGDGTFAVRLSLPDRRQVIPIVASSYDGVEQRTTILAVERNTKVMEPLVRDVTDTATRRGARSLSAGPSRDRVRRRGPPARYRGLSLSPCNNTAWKTPSRQTPIGLSRPSRRSKAAIVAYSGGVDSAVVAKAAHLALGERAIAVTGVSASLAAGELEAAQRVAAAIGIRHETIATDELADAEYLRNAPDRCFHCKTELYDATPPTRPSAAASPTILNGANADDLGDFRPGHAGRRRARRAQPAGRMRPEQGRRPGARPPLGHRGVGQARHALPVEPHRLRRERDARAAGPHRRRRASAAGLELGDRPRAAARKRAGPPGGAAGRAAAAVRSRRPRRPSSPGCANWVSATSRSTSKASAPGAFSSSCRAKS